MLTCLIFGHKKGNPFQSKGIEKKDKIDNFYLFSFSSDNFKTMNFPYCEKCGSVFLDKGRK